MKRKLDLLRGFVGFCEDARGSLELVLDWVQSPVLVSILMRLRVTFWQRVSLPCRELPSQ